MNNTTMNTVALRAAVNSQLAFADMRAAVVAFVTDESGADDAPSRMIWLAVSIGLAITAGYFIIDKFTAAQGSVPDPVAPQP